MAVFFFYTKESPGHTAPGKEDPVKVKIIWFVTVIDFWMPYVTWGCFYVPRSWIELFSTYGYLRMVCDELQIYINYTNISHSKRIRYIKETVLFQIWKFFCVHRNLLFQSLFTFYPFEDEWIQWVILSKQEASLFCPKHLLCPTHTNHCSISNTIQEKNWYNIDNVSKEK